MVAVRGTRAAPAGPPRVRYAPRGPFHRDLQTAVHDALGSAGRLGRGDPRLWFKATFLAAWFYGSLAVLLLVALDPWQVPLAALSLGLAAAGTMMATTHDAIHGTLAARPSVNAAVAYLAAPIGISRRWWQAKHNVLHHGYTNVSGIDDDIEFGRLARFSPNQRWRPWHRWQHLYVWACYPFLYLAMALTGDLPFILRGRIGERSVDRPSAARTVVLVVEKYLGIGLILGAALAFRPALAVLAVYVGAALVTGTILALVFQVEHLVETTVFPRPDAEGRVGDEWAVSQVVGSADVATGNRLYTWYVGGLNLHVEHHLFPRMAHVYLPAAVPIVRQVCADHGVVRTEFPTIAAALASHHRLLRRLGTPSTVLIGSRVAPLPVA